MRIAIVSERVYPFKGGTETRWDEIGSRLTDLGHEVTFLTGRGDITRSNPNPSQYQFRESHHDYEIHRIVDYKPAVITKGTRSVENCINFGRNAALYLNKMDDVDVIDINVFPHLHLPLISLLYGNNTIITWHEVWKEEWRRHRGFGKFGKEVEWLNAQLGSRHIAVSKFTAERLSHLKVLRHNSIYHIPNGVSDDFFDIEDNSAEYPRFLSVGRLTPEKNIDSILIDSFNHYLETYGKATLDIVGNGPLLDEIKRKTSTNDHITVHGSVDQQTLYSLFADCNVFLLPSAREGSAIVAKEANAVGMPVVTIDFPNNAAAFETVQDGYNGIVTSKDKFTEAMLQAFKNQDKLGKNAKDYSKRFQWKLIIKKIEKVYELQASS